MRIETSLMQELEDLPLIDKVMSILTDVHELTKKIIEKKTNVLETFEIPFKSAFDQFFEKEGKNIREDNPSYLQLASNQIFQQKLIEFSLGDKKTTRKEAYFREAFRDYQEMIEKKLSSSAQKPLRQRNLSTKESEQSLDFFITDDKELSKIKDLIEFIYIYRYNQKLTPDDNSKTEELLKYLNTVYNRKYGENFLQNNLDIYQQIEAEIEQLIEVPDKIKKIEEMIDNSNWNTMKIYSMLYWLYSRGEMNLLAGLMKEQDFPENFREYVVDLILKRSEMRSKNVKINETVRKSKELVRDIISQLNDRVIPIISKPSFERLIAAGVNYFPDYYKTSTVSRIKDNVFLYIKAEKIKNG